MRKFTRGHTLCLISMVRSSSLLKNRKLLPASNQNGNSHSYHNPHKRNLISSLGMVVIYFAQQTSPHMWNNFCRNRRCLWAYCNSNRLLIYVTASLVFDHIAWLDTQDQFSRLPVVLRIETCEEISGELSECVNASHRLPLHYNKHLYFDSFTYQLRFTLKCHFFLYYFWGVECDLLLLLLL